MSKKTNITIAVVLAVAAIAVAFGIQSNSIEQKAAAQSETERIPEYVLYEQVFRLTIAFKIKAEADEQGGEEVSAFATYFKDKAQLTEPENEILKQVAAEFVQEVESIDQEAEALIQGLREKASSEEYIEPPPELLTLQEERNNLALLYRSQLNSSLGSEAFSRLNNFVKGEFASGIQVMTPSLNPNDEDRGGRK